MTQKQTAENPALSNDSRNRGEKMILLSLLGVTVLLLFLMLARERLFTDTKKTYNISVLVREPDERFLKGVEQAALDFNVDIHVVSIYERGDSTRQIQYFARELENNADAVIIEPENGGEIEKYMAGLNTKPVVISVGQQISEKKYGLYVGSDNKQTGRLLGEMIAESMPGRECLILCPVSDKKYIRDRRDGLKDVLIENGIAPMVYYCKEDEIARVISGKGGGVIVAVDEHMALPLVDAAGETDTLFAAGYHANMRSFIETGRIAALVTYSGFDAGYLAVSAAIDSLEKKPAKDILLESRRVDKDNMYDDPVVQMLFPIG